MLEGVFAKFEDIYRKGLWGCAKCDGLQKKCADFSKNQWRKGLRPGHAKCTGCVQQYQGEGEAGGRSNKISRESMIVSITCDAEGCGNSSPVSHGVIYCSETCQRRHQGSHSQECIDVNWMRKQTHCYEEPNGDCKRGTAMAGQLLW